MASVKQVIFGIFNLIFFLLGCAVLGIGIYSKVQDDNWNELIKGSVLIQASNILIAAGLFVALLGFFGCFGAFKQSWVMLAIYAALFLGIFLLQIAAGIYSYVKRNKVKATVKDGVTLAVKNSYSGDSLADKGVKKAVDWLQRKLDCCGYDNSSDWKNSKWAKQTPNLSKKAPISCCIVEVVGCNLDAVSKITLYKKGCVEEGIKFLKDNLALIGGIGVGIAVIELLGIICAIVLAGEYRKGGGD